MPTNGTARGMSALAGFGLLFTAIVLCYLNSTTSNPILSLVYFASIGITSLAMAAKWATALGVENKLAVWGDKVASLVPWVALVFNGIQVLHYNSDGLDGMMAGIALIALVFVVAFGLADSIGSLVGQKFKNVSDALTEANRRVHDASVALRSSQRN